MKIRNKDRVVHICNLTASPPTSLHLTPGETSRELKREDVESSVEIQRLLKRGKLVEVETKAADIKKPSKKKGADSK